MRQLVFMVRLTLSLGLVAGGGLNLEAAASSHKPRRPIQHGDDTDVTATIQTGKPVPAVKPKAPVDDETLPPPFRLPTASRERMRDCGVKWQDMKMAGVTGTDTWREFATVCLAAAAPPDRPGP